ncbi:hypothetical protein SLEP1_g3234 [Rubroshorea leprosula]|uniref:Uncharacterized protein n=1 Tax=Rubroshorea leprosula TaxID=152421 RepID=A0AAV5HK60_9ROSI|nr:hypothetical protein SLEP1_g3234 [Rubroshorea leprosula]
MVCKARHEGGLGVKSIRTFNLSLLGKWWGKLAKGEVGLWSRLIKEKYGVGNENWMSWVKDGRGEGSSWWKDVCRIDVLGENRNGWLSNGFEIILGDGEEVSFWWDSWCEEGVLAHRFPRLYMLSAGMDYKIKQMGVWIEDKWSWTLPWRRLLLDRESQAVEELKKVLESTKLYQGRKDKWVWKFSIDGCYTTRSGYSNLTATQMKSHKYVFGRVWNPNAPTKNRCFNWWGVQTVLASNIWDVFNNHEGIAVSKRMRIGWEMVWLALVWTIWLTRNEILFNNKMVDTNKIFDYVQVRSFLWLTNRGKVLRYGFSDWLLNPHLWKEIIFYSILPKCWRGVAGLLRNEDSSCEDNKKLRRLVIASRKERPKSVEDDAQLP